MVTDLVNPHYLYWIKHKSHTDFLTEGYIGITYDFEKRMLKHKANIKSHKMKVYSFLRQFNKEDLEFKVLVIGSEKYCRDLEYKIRPLPDIGWNSAQGGGKKKPLELEEKLRSSLSNFQSSGRVNKTIPSFEEYEASNSDQIQKLKSETDSLPIGPFIQRKQSIAKQLAFLENGPWSNNIKHDLWLSADKVFEVWRSNDFCGSRRLSKLLGYENRSATIKTMIKHFDLGWNPLKDIRWTDYAIID
jgi:predicted GIY-YIG superfamily endonuclease